MPTYRSFSVFETNQDSAADKGGGRLLHLVVVMQKLGGMETCLGWETISHHYSGTFCGVWHPGASPAMHYRNFWSFSSRCSWVHIFHQHISILGSNLVARALCLHKNAYVCSTLCLNERLNVVVLLLYGQERSALWSEHGWIVVGIQKL